MTTVSSRVDVGADAKNRQSKQPVLGKVRKFSERIRGFFKSKGESPFKGRGTGHAPEYGMMTTTTAVTNVEYESVRFFHTIVTSTTHQFVGTSHPFAQSSS